MFLCGSYFFSAKLLPNSHFLRIGSSSGQLLFGTATFLMKDLVHNKDIYRRATFSMQVLLHINNFFRTDTLMSENFAGRKFRANQAFREIFLISREFNFANGKNRYLFSPFLEKTIKIEHLSLLINKNLCSLHF